MRQFLYFRSWKVNTQFIGCRLRLRRRRMNGSSVCVIPLHIIHFMRFSYNGRRRPLSRVSRLSSGTSNHICYDKLAMPFCSFLNSCITIMILLFEIRRQKEILCKQITFTLLIMMINDESKRENNVA